MGALAWILLASPGVGLINQLWTFLGFDGTRLNIYSHAGIIFVGALHDMPLVFLMVAGAPRSRDPTLDRKRVVQGKSVSVRVDLGGRRIIQQKILTDTMCNR